MNKSAIGYLPDERPTTWKLVLYALQQVIVMFPATVAVALIAGFPVSTTIFASGLATLCFTLITGGKIPLYYGSSFAYLSAVASVGSIQEAQCGIIASGLVSIAAGLLVKKFGKGAVEKILPGSVSGSVAMVIGLTLVGNAMADAIPAAGSDNATPWVVVSMVTLISTILYSKYLKGFLGQLPLLFGALTGSAVAGIYALAGINLFKGGAADGLLALPEITLPKFSWPAIVAIMPVAIATIPESTAHMYQLDVYINNIAKEKGKDHYDMIGLLDRNLIGDGLCDMIAGLVGGPAGTNYGENISTMAITKVFSVPVLVAASIIAMLISCFTPLINVISGIPTAVIGGLEIYLFGAIAAQGIAIMIDKQVDLFDSKNIAVIATIMTVGVGGQYAFPNGNIPFFGMSIPCVAGASIFGIIMNLILSIGEKKKDEEEAE